MPPTVAFSHVRRVVLAVTVLAVVAVECHAIEMFTYFGDGSRIGLPSLEVPIEAYPGIPLRSDRLRARRRAMRMGPAAVAPQGPRSPSRSITIRAMPEVLEAQAPRPKPPATSSKSEPIVEEIPVAPSPDEIAP